jgi:protein-tyrosine phosphatase
MVNVSITTQLFLCDVVAARAIVCDADAGFDAVITLMSEPPWPPSHCKIPWHYFQLDDTMCMLKGEFMNTIKPVARLIGKYIRQRKKILVHCRAGTNRSCAALVMYFIHYAPTADRLPSLECARSYIERAKKEQCVKPWATLTNSVFVSYLMACNR